MSGAEMTKFVRWAAPERNGIREPCTVIGDLVKKTAQSWMYRYTDEYRRKCREGHDGHPGFELPTSIQRTKKFSFRSANSSWGGWSLGDRGDSITSTPAHVEPCPHCPDWNQANEGEQK